MSAAFKKFVRHALDAIAVKPIIADAAGKTLRLLRHLFAADAARTFRLRWHLAKRTCWRTTGKDRGKEVWVVGESKSDKGLEKGEGALIEAGLFPARESNCRRMSPAIER